MKKFGMTKWAVILALISIVVNVLCWLPGSGEFTIYQPAFGVVSTTDTVERFAANGSATTFNFTFRLTDQTEMQALVRADSTGIDTAFELNVDYTLAATNNDFSSGGTLTTTDTLASGNTLILHREAKRTQTVNLIQGQAMPAEATETTFDKQTLAIQDIDKDLLFVPGFPKGDPAAALGDWPSSIDRAGRAAAFDSTTGAPTAIDLTTGVTVTAFAETYLDDTTASATRTTLGLAIGTDVQAWDAQLDDIAALAVTNSNFIVGDGANWVAESGATVRTSLGLAIGTDVHAFTTNGNTILTDAGILSIAGLSTAADKMIYTTASDTYTTTDLTAYSRTLFDDVDAAAWRVTLGVVTAADAINKDGSVAYTGTGVGFKDEDDMTSDSAVATASQQSIKAYIDAYIKLVDSKSATTSGGTATAGSWQKRTVTEESDVGAHVSVSSSVFILDAGTYQCRISAPAFLVNNHQLRLRNTTGGSTVLVGTMEYSVSGTPSQTRSEIVGIFTIAGSQNLEIQHRVETTRATDGFGNGTTDLGEVTIYTIAEFWKR